MVLFSSLYNNSIFIIIIGKTGEEGTHCVRIKFKGGWPDPPTPVFIDANVTVFDINKQPLHVCKINKQTNKELINFIYSPLQEL